jgi:hypothetical protein
MTTCVWGHLDSIITHPTGSRLQRVDIDIQCFLHCDDTMQEPYKGLTLISNVFFTATTLCRNPTKMKSWKLSLMFYLYFTIKAFCLSNCWNGKMCHSHRGMPHWSKWYSIFICYYNYYNYSIQCEVYTKSHILLSIYRQIQFNKYWLKKYISEISNMKPSENIFG